MILSFTVAIQASKLAQGYLLKGLIDFDVKFIDDRRVTLPPAIITLA
jgi:hypothetical protein